MSAITLPPLARPLLARLMRKDGHITRNSSGARHLAKCQLPCCTARGTDPSVSVTLSGATGCAAAANGTYVIPKYGQCTFRLEDFTTPPDYCSGACYEGYYGIYGRHYLYWHYQGVRLWCELDAATAVVRVYAEVWYQGWWNSNGLASCRQYSPMRVDLWFSRDTCDSGEMTLTESNDPYVNNFGFNPLGTQPTTCLVSF